MMEMCRKASRSCLHKALKVVSQTLRLFKKYLIHLFSNWNVWSFGHSPYYTMLTKLLFCFLDSYYILAVSLTIPTKNRETMGINTRDWHIFATLYMADINFPSLLLYLHYTLPPSQLIPTSNFPSLMNTFVFYNLGGPLTIIFKLFNLLIFKVTSRPQKVRKYFNVHK